MGSLLKKKSVKISTSEEGLESYNSPPPKGAEIISRSVRVETEQIENGWLISKYYDGRYKTKGDDSTQYFNYCKKWYSEEDPLSIELTDKTLADAFSE